MLRGAECRVCFFDSKDDGEQRELKKCVDWLASYANGRRSRLDRPTLVVCSLDRLASSIDRLTEIIGELEEKGIAIEILRDGIRGESAAVLARVLRLVRDFRRENIADKSQRGVLVAEKRSLQTGRPAKLTEAKLQLALREMAEGKVVAEVAKRAGVSVPTLYRYKAAYDRRK
jgi:DNA invertase Pin-like site-specific DNA recombinase